MPVFLDFEEPIADLFEQLEKAQQTEAKGKVDVKDTIADLEAKIEKTRKEIYKELTPWQRVQTSRHPERPYTLSYIRALSEDTFIELHGDRNVKDDKAMIGGFGMFEGQSVMFIGQQKGENTKMRQYRNFGMSNPEGYRKALRLMKLAEKFNKPIVTLIDTPGAYPGLEAEERGQGEAIARNLIEMAQLTVPVICIVIGEGASGGALGIGIGDKVFMLENAWYSVISPENCSAILWRNWDHKETAADALKLTANNMLDNGLIDGIIPEPAGGAHADREKAFSFVRKAIKENLAELWKLDADERVDLRIEKFSNMGVVQD
jgi:acetyl-CoA carboxylase carboxyl transferase subunit alpha